MTDSRGTPPALRPGPVRVDLLRSAAREAECVKYDWRIPRDRDPIRVASVGIGMLSGALAYLMNDREKPERKTEKILWKALQSVVPKNK